ncbi:MAG: single-stranded DNA-binding protein [Legionellales bacterium]|nr:single-stranded DNA-binding protein [Legionellales bacterium]|tara:strand:- start:467 stop:805 length:339 start_codon:yes stop_codon:yes gene_type:complete
MSKSFNQVILMGYVGSDPQVSGEGKKPFARFSLATNKRYKVENEIKEETHWHNLVSFNGVVDIVKDYVKKGSKVQIIGELANNNWTDKEGNEHIQSNVLVNQIILMDDKQKA